MSARKPQRPLRRGWTTGACATAATTAAYRALLTGRFDAEVAITLPKGERPTFQLCRAEMTPRRATAGIIKDAGDDPDVTHQAEIMVTVEAGEEGSGVGFRAGQGVGTVTLPGLPIAVGEPAINPAPRAMMVAAVANVAEELDAPGDVVITVSIPGGELLAEKTANPRLGITGGLSVLGTTGVVIPYSCASWIHSIHSGIDVARASGIDHIAASTGRTSEEAVCKHHDLPDAALIDMGDFAGGLFKYLRRHPLPRLTIAGGFAKTAKLAGGHLDLHSDRSQVDFPALAAMLGELGAGPEAVERAAAANSAGQVLAEAGTLGPGLADLIAARAREVALATLSGETAVEVVIFDRAGTLIGHAGG
jgi:cobalt-precorrin-5B (C1)-methyltransferase